MKVKFLVSIAGFGNARFGLGEFSFTPGEVATVHPDLAARWMAAAICAAVPEEPEKPMRPESEIPVAMKRAKRK